MCIIPSKCSFYILVVGADTSATIGDNSNSATATPPSTVGGGSKPSLTNFPHMNERPTMKQLNMLERRDSRDPIRIITRIGKKYAQLGDFLLNDEDGAVMTIITENSRGNVEDINREMLRRWLAGAGADVSWKVLVETLKNCELKILAEDIVDALQHT